MKDRKPTIIALGGGGFSMEENPALDRYVIEQTGKDCPRVCFVPTASGDADSYVAKFHAAFSELSCETSHLTFFRRTEPDLESFVMAQDVIYVGGGNTRSLLAVWRDWGLDKILNKAWQSGVVLAGVSAGAICWFEEGVTDSVGGELRALDCLGFLPGSCCPHYDGEADRRPTYHKLLSSGGISSGLALDDGAAAHFEGTEMKQLVSSRDDARGYALTIESSSVRETPLEPVILSS